MTDDDFFLQISIPYLETPFMMSIMITDVILLCMVMLGRVQLGSRFNKQFENFEEKVHEIKENFNLMY